MWDLVFALRDKIKTKRKGISGIIIIGVLFTIIVMALLLWWFATKLGLLE